MWNPKKRKPVAPRAANQNPPAPRRNPALRAGEVMNSDLAELLARGREGKATTDTRLSSGFSTRISLARGSERHGFPGSLPCRTPGHWAISRKDFEEMDRSPVSSCTSSPFAVRVSDPSPKNLFEIWPNALEFRKGATP